MSSEKQKEKLSSVYVDMVSKKAAQNFVIEGELASVCHPQQVVSDMQSAKEKEGFVYIYKRKKEVKAICIFAVEEREIPLKAAVVEKEQLVSDALKEKKDRLAEAEEEMEMVTKNCYVLKGFYVAPSYEERRGELKELFERVAKEHMLLADNKIPAYIWEDEIVMSNQIISDGKMVSAAGVGAGMGAAIGVLLGIIFGRDSMNLGQWMLWGLVIGGIIAGGTTTMKTKITLEK